MGKELRKEAGETQKALTSQEEESPRTVPRLRAWEAAKGPKL